jgi:hypothetical protein
VQQRDELRLPPLVRREAQAIAHGQHEIDDVTAVTACVGVVGLDDVAEQQGRSAICLR